MEAVNLSFVLLACSFVASAAPASNRRQDLQHIVSFINNIADVQRIRDTIPPLSSLDAASPAKVSDFPEMPDSELIGSLEDEESLAKGFLGKPIGPVKKRQGAWSYDYGLGGGRFGKRNYGDYGIGGGRFGRDLDHVDLTDAIDADLAS